MRYNLFRVVAVGILLFLLGAMPTFPAEPDATVKITGKSVAACVGNSWGSGVLIYQGKEYPFTVTGISAGDIDGSQVATDCCN
jgi:hypothetical protein